LDSALRAKKCKKGVLTICHHEGKVPTKMRIKAKLRRGKRRGMLSHRWNLFFPARCIKKRGVKNFSSGKA